MIVTHIRSLLLVGIVMTVVVYEFIQIKYHDIKTAVAAQEQDIQIISIAQIGGWGEWFQEYSLVIEKDESEYRIWTDTDGDIYDWEALDEGS
ncbi:hypothetical protein [Jeotgalibacillus terrae]|uniref:DUF3139 domain-containing protein n=1 Tax=Jeotgalibacillus terrae TaxID=587735 RepID=A0ABW5ZKB3_9BACL|nr:hypothetical protein [Jeotgalibacillus terrae]MBM7578769.1 hypothetical protein [Jeotgalibacillus terrae]